MAYSNSVPSTLNFSFVHFWFAKNTENSRLHINDSSVDVKWHFWFQTNGQFCSLALPTKKMMHFLEAFVSAALMLFQLSIRVFNF